MEGGGVMAYARGEGLPHKLTEQQVRNIRKAAAMGINEHYLAAIYHVSRINIWSIVKRQSWSHVK